MKKKTTRSSPVSNRTVIGIICVAAALTICFGLAPVVNHFADRKADIVRVVSKVERGHIIKETDVEVVTVGSYNLPAGLITNKADVVGKTAGCDLFAGDYITPAKLSNGKFNATDVLLGLDGTKVAVSVSISSFAEGLSGKIENGDIVSVIIYDKDEYTSYIPPELKYVKVITTTTSSGVDKNEVTDGTQATTVTFLVTPEQAELLAQYESTRSMHLALVYRGNTEKANEYIKAQDTHLDAASSRGGATNE